MRGKKNQKQNKSKGVLNGKKDTTTSLTGPLGAIELMEHVGDS